MVEEGLEARIARHVQNGRALQAGVAAMDLTLATVAGHCLPQLTCVRIPDGIDDLTVRKRLLKEWSIEIGGGLGPFKGKAWRIGLMGHSSRRENVTLVLTALEKCLRDLGHARLTRRGRERGGGSLWRARRRSRPLDKCPRRDSASFPPLPPVEGRGEGSALTGAPRLCAAFYCTLV